MDINSDLGEGMAHDSQIMPYIDRCNIACGGHAGSRELILNTIRVAQSFGVSVGAHPSYPDRANFGRISMKMSHQELKQCLRFQLALFYECAQLCGATPTHIKPHGALYHDVAQKPEVAGVFLEVIEDICPEITVITAVHSALFDYTTPKKITLWTEGFVDRNYNADLTLVPRHEPNSIIHDPKQAQQQLIHLRDGWIQSADGRLQPIHVNTCCVHSDHPNSVAIAKAVSAVNRLS